MGSHTGIYRQHEVQMAAYKKKSRELRLHPTTLAHKKASYGDNLSSHYSYGPFPEYYYGAAVTYSRRIRDHGEITSIFSSRSLYQRLQGGKDLREMTLTKTEDSYLSLLISANSISNLSLLLIADPSTSRVGKGHAPRRRNEI
jgi:hypothetical protein